MDPEVVHDRAIRMGRILGSNVVFRKITGLFFNYSNPVLRQDILGIVFKNPVGLAAGFDKNAQIIKIMKSVGFGYTEIGSITGEYCPGNEKPRLWRLIESKGLVVNYGLKNNGADEISKRLINLHSSIPMGVNVAKTNSKDTVELEDGINDYIKGIKSFLNIGDYLTINISCPNAFGGEPFTEPEKLELLLKRIDELNIEKPVFLKMAANIPESQIDQIIELSNQYKVSGFICTNLSKNRNNPKIIDKLPDIGSISGKPVEDESNRLIEYIYRKTEGNKIIIGCGGIFSAEDAYAKIKLGASLVQLITGMIFEGPQLISEINQGLVKLIKQDGFNNISQAIGKDIK